MPTEKLDSTGSIREIQLGWDEFVIEIRKDKGRHRCKWRGAKSDAHFLESSFQRKVLKPLPEEWRTLPRSRALQDRLHRYFALAIRGMRGEHPTTLDYNQVWAMGRHFGLNTPYLDWSNSPYLAAFFSVFDLVDDYLGKAIVPHLAWFDEGRNSQPDGRSTFPSDARFAVYRLELTEELFPWVGPVDQLQECEKRDKQRKQTHESPEPRQQKQFETWNPFLCDTSANIRRFGPKQSFLPEGEWLLFLDVNVEEVRRLQGQRGYFTVLHSAKHLSIEPFLKEHGAASCLKKYTIPLTDLRKAFEHLLSHGIDHQLIYPDLDGAAKQANLMCHVDMFHDVEERQTEATGSG